MSDSRYTDGTIQAYLDRLASAEPEPGGGSVSALVGALGAALVTMVTDLTLGKEKFAEVQEDMAGLQEPGELLRAELQELVTEDARAYAAVAAAMKLPKDTDERRSSASRRCSRHCAALPRCRCEWPRERWRWPSSRFRPGRWATRTRSATPVWPVHLADAALRARRST